MTDQSEKLDILRNIRGLQADYKTQSKRYPTNLEISKALNMPIRTARDYVKVIQSEDKQRILDLFQGDIIAESEKLSKVIDENVTMFQEIRDDNSLSAMVRMDAAKNMEVSIIDSLRIKRDAPEFLQGDYSDDEEPKKIKEEVKDVQV